MGNDLNNSKKPQVNYENETHTAESNSGGKLFAKLGTFSRSLTPANFKKFRGFVKAAGIRGAITKMQSYVTYRRIAENLLADSFLDDEERTRQEKTVFPKDVKFSILVPLYNTPLPFLREMIESVQKQTYKNWELCLADGSDAQHGEVGDVCREYAENDSRIIYKKLEKNLGISENTNACIDMATGNYISLFDHDDVLHPSALFKTMEKICNENADYIYTDEMTFSGELSNVLTAHFKPDYSIDTLRANNYICHFSSFSRELLDKSGRFRSEFDGSQDHDLILRLTENANCVAHIPEILYYWRSHSASVAQDINSKPYAIKAGQNAAKESIERSGLKAEVTSSKASPVIYRFKYEIKGNPLVSVIIFNGSNAADLQQCENSLKEITSYGNFEIIAADENRSDVAAAISSAVKQAKGDYIVLTDSKIKIINRDWLTELLMYAQREDVGAVGGKLYFYDNTVENAGYVLGTGKDGIAESSHFGAKKVDIGYMGRLSYACDVSAVPATLMMFKKADFEVLGGFREEFPSELYDIDFCLRLLESGKLNVFTPYCEAYLHKNKAAVLKNSELYEGELKAFRKYWQETLDKGDPYYNPNFLNDKYVF